ncbi:hypothetical protein EMCRGX_G030314 [Ephydatia muelleri]
MDVELNGERQGKVSINVNGKGQNKEVIKDLEAREEIANSRSRKGPWEGRKRKRKKRQCGDEAREREEGKGVGGVEDKGEIKNGDNEVDERGGYGRAAKVGVGGKTAGQGKEKRGVGEKSGGNGEGGKIQWLGGEWEIHKMSPLGLSKLPLEHCCEHLHTRIEELLLDILYSSTKMHEELKKDETESLTDVTMIQLEGLLIGAVITCTVHGNGIGPIILDQPVFTKADQQLLGSSYT